MWNTPVLGTGQAALHTYLASRWGVGLALSGAVTGSLPAAVVATYTGVVGPLTLTAVTTTGNVPVCVGLHRKLDTYAAARGPD